MDVKPGYKQTDIGPIPTDWKVGSIQDLGNLRTGPFGTLLKAEEYSGGEGVPLVSVREIGAGRLRIDERTPLVPKSVVRRLPEYVLLHGDIVFGRKGAVDRSALVAEQQSGCFLSSDGIRLRLSDASNPQFVSFQFQSANVQSWLIQHATGTTMASMNQDILLRVRFALPPIDEQNAIAEALSDADALMDSLEQIIAKKRAVKLGVVQELLTGQRRLPEFQGTTGHHQTDVGWLPDDWESRTTREIASPVRNAIVGGPFGSDLVSADYADDGVPVIRGQNMGAASISGSFVFVSPSKARSLEANLARPGDLVFTQRGTLGQVSLVPSGPFDRYLVSQSQMKLTVNRKIADPKFLQYVYGSPAQQEFIVQNTIQTGVPHINLGILRTIPVQLPSLAEQEAIAAVLSDMDAEIEALEQKLAKARQVKQGMMQELLTGRVRLPLDGTTQRRIGFLDGVHDWVVPDDFDRMAEDEIRQMFEGEPE